MFSMRIVNVDHYSTFPKSGLDLTYSQFRGTEIKSVPVIRIFGSTAEGRKACLHIHGVFPYLLVPYGSTEEGGRFMDQLASSIDKAINISLGTSMSPKQHVCKIILVSGRPFYGYHGQDHQYLKIFFYNPLMVKRASELLQNGAICGSKFQIHEGHVPFILQFFIDYNLYGMSLINLKNVIYRKDASPAGVAPGNIIRDSYCELEADAVAVDILNRLTVEGELAVNPGLAAIWEEEKERLKKDALESSQRPTPQKTLSELLLKDKLKDNLKFQGKCRPSLKESIPYPAETQRSSVSDIMDASVLDTHSVFSLARTALTETQNDHDITVVDEELVLNLTQNSQNVTNLNLDQSLLVALDTLAVSDEELAALLSQDVEQDSILGSQLLPAEDDLPVDDYSLPADKHILSSDDSSEDCFDHKIPQLDGIGDVLSNKRKTSKKKKRQALAASIVDEKIFLEGDETLINNLKDGNCWPESENPEGLEDIFSDDESFNSPIHSLEDDRCDEYEENFNIDLITSFETLLHGDPTLTSGDGVLSEDPFLQNRADIAVWNKQFNTEDSCTQEVFRERIENFTSNLIEAKDKNPETNALENKMPFLNNILGPTEEKQMALPSFSEIFLNTRQLDEIFNEDLNKGLDIIYESNSQHESSESSSPPEATEIAVEKSLSLPEEIGSCYMIDKKYIKTVNCNTPEMKQSFSNDEVTNIKEDEQVTDKEFELLCQKSYDCNGDNIDDKLIVNDNKEAATESFEANDNTPLEINHGVNQKISQELEKISQKSKSPKIKNECCKQNNKLIVKFTNNKKSHHKEQNNSIVMSGKEIECYFSQLEYLATHFKERENLEGSIPVTWTPLRKLNYCEKKKRNRRKTKLQFSPTKFMKKYKLSENEMKKLTTCYVRLSRSINEISNESTSHFDKSGILSNTKKIKSCRPKSTDSLGCTRPINTNKVNLQLVKSTLKSKKVIQQSKKTEGSITNKENSLNKKDGLASKKITPHVKQNNKASLQKHNLELPLKVINSKVPSIKKPDKVTNNKGQSDRKSEDKSMHPTPYVLVTLPKRVCDLKTINKKRKTKPPNKKVNKTYETNNNILQCHPLNPEKLSFDSGLKSTTKMLPKKCETVNFITKRSTKRRPKTSDKQSDTNLELCDNPKNELPMKESSSEVERQLHNFSKDPPSMSPSVVLKDSFKVVIEKKRLLKGSDDRLNENSQQTDTNCEVRIKLKNLLPKKKRNSKVVQQSRNLNEVPPSMLPSVILKDDFKVIAEKVQKGMYNDLNECSQNRFPVVVLEKPKHIYTVQQIKISKSIKDKKNKEPISVLKSIKPLSSKVHCKNRVKEKKTPKIYCLDGTVDSSSSDESVKDTKTNSSTLDTKQRRGTPKRRKQSSIKNITPKKSRYIPLQIEIQKSPKVRSKNEEGSKRLPSDLEPESIAVEKKSSFKVVASGSREKNAVMQVSTTEDIDEPPEKRSKLEAVVKVQRLSIPCDTSSNYQSSSSSHKRLLRSGVSLPSSSQWQDITENDLSTRAVLIKDPERWK